MKVEVLGAGCAKCRATKKAIKGVIQDLRRDAELVEVSDFDEIVDRGVMVTPGVFVNGELKSTGRVPSKNEIVAWLSARLDESEVAAVNDTQAEGPCACLYYAMEQVKIIKNEPALYKLTCRECGKVFKSNVQKDYCFDCENKKG